MTPSHGLAIEHASIEDAEETLQLQRVAYLSEAEFIADYSIPPLHQTIDEVES